MAAELAGVRVRAIYRLREREPGFSERMAEAVAKADARLVFADAKGAPPPSCGRSSSPAKPGEDLEAGLVVRRGIGGRLRLMAAGRRWCEDRHDPVFLGHLAATGNVEASARAVGFTKKVAYDRRKARPDFAAGWVEALELADVHLNGRLIAEAHRGLVAMDEDAFEAADAAPFDPWLAIRLCQYWEKKRAPRSGGAR